MEYGSQHSTHFGEWWGSGIQRGYGLQKGEKRFSLFNVARWLENDDLPAFCNVVPVLFKGLFATSQVEKSIVLLKQFGSYAAPGFLKPEGVVVFHVAANIGFKVTIEKDDKPKSAA